MPIEMNIISLMRNRIEGKEEVSETGDVEQVVRTVFLINNRTKWRSNQ